jgi:hypothetical protein
MVFATGIGVCRGRVAVIASRKIPDLKELSNLGMGAVKSSVRSGPEQE